VRFVWAMARLGCSLRGWEGVLGDVAPTVLDVMGLGQPEEMSGGSLLVRG